MTNLAARMQTAAPAGSIAASEPTGGRDFFLMWSVGTGVSVFNDLARFCWQLFGPSLHIRGRNEKLKARPA